MIAELSNVSLQYGNKTILSSLNLNLEEKKIHGLIGRNAAGKTQVLKILAGLLSPSARFSGKKNSPDQIGYVFQKPMLFPWLTLEQNLHIIPEIQRDTVENYLARFELHRLAKLYPYQVSGGTQQKINLIRGFLVNAPLILLDEPFSALDLPQKNDLSTLLLDLWNEDKTILMVTHEIDEALLLCHQVHFLSKKNKNIMKTWNLPGSIPRSLETVRNDENFRKIYLEIGSLLTEDADV